LPAQRRHGADAFVGSETIAAVLDHIPHCWPTVVNQCRPSQRPTKAFTRKLFKGVMHVKAAQTWENLPVRWSRREGCGEGVAEAVGRCVDQVGRVVFSPAINQARAGTAVHEVHDQIRVPCLNGNGREYAVGCEFACRLAPRKACVGIRATHRSRHQQQLQYMTRKVQRGLQICTLEWPARTTLA
jgi:hypothetical protein